MRKKAQHKRKETGDDRWKAPIEKKSGDKSVLRTVGTALLRPFEILLFEPMALILNLYSAILLGILYLFFGAFPFVFQGAFGFTLWQTGLAFLGLLIGMFTGAMSSGLWQKVRMRLVERNGVATGVPGKSEPEFRLPSVIVGSVLVTVGLFWFAWTTFPWVHWILPIIGSVIFGIGVSLISFVVFCLHAARAWSETGCAATDVPHHRTWFGEEMPCLESARWPRRVVRLAFLRNVLGIYTSNKAASSSAALSQEKPLAWDALNLIGEETLGGRGGGGALSHRSLLAQPQCHEDEPARGDSRAEMPSSQPNFDCFSHGFVRKRRRERRGGKGCASLSSFTPHQIGLSRAAAPCLAPL